MTWSDGSDKVSIKWNGAFRVSDDDRDVVFVEDGATVSISDGQLLSDRVELRGVGARIERTFYRNSIRRDYEPEGRAFLAATLQKVIRRTGLFAADRVARFLKQGGPDAVLAEIDRLGESSSKRAYYRELLKQAEVTDALITKVLQRITGDKTLTSDYERSVLLTELAKQPTATDAHRMQIAEAAKTIGSDYEQRRALGAVLAAAPAASAAVARAVLAATTGIASSHERSELLIQIVNRGGVTAETASEFFAAATTVGSSFDMSRVLSAVAARPKLPDSILAGLLQAAGRIQSSHDRTNLLVRVAGSQALTGSTRQLYLTTARAIGSEMDQNRALAVLVRIEGR